MENTGNMNSQELKIQSLLDRYLASRSLNQISSAQSSLHLDDDALTAFTEGNLSEREAAPMVAHLVDCSFCRHVTAELVRLDLEFATDAQTAPVAAREAEPSKISEVLSGLLSRIFGSNDDAVFAHGEKEEAKKEEEGTAKDEQ